MATEVEPLGSVRIATDQPPVPRRVPIDAPWMWLAAGWRDMWCVPFISLGYGALFALGAALLSGLLLRFQALSLLLPLAGGFLLIGPFLAVGLYAASRQLSSGANVRLAAVAWSWTAARGQLGFFGVALLIVYFGWLQAAFLLLMLFLGGAGLPPPDQFMHTLLFTPRGLGLLVVGTIVGSLLATLVFAISAFAVPMLLARSLDAVTAARASVAAVALNPKPMALWAGLIAVIMAAGFACLLIGLVIAFPLIGHASWHAYVDVFGDPPKT